MKSAMQIAAEHKIGDQPEGIGIVIAAMVEYGEQEFNRGKEIGGAEIYEQASVAYLTQKRLLAVKDEKIRQLEAKLDSIKKTIQQREDTK